MLQTNVTFALSRKKCTQTLKLNKSKVYRSAILWHMCHYFCQAHMKRVDLLFDKIEGMEYQGLVIQN